MKRIAQVLTLGILCSLAGEAVAACLSVESARSYSYWVNSCGYRVGVKWKDERDCRPESYAEFPCERDVPAYSRESINLIEGNVTWFECRRPKMFRENPRGVVRCR